jgi:hypothetical protein
MSWPDIEKRKVAVGWQSYTKRLKAVVTTGYLLVGFQEDGGLD